MPKYLPTPQVVSRSPGASFAGAHDGMMERHHPMKFSILCLLLSLSGCQSKLPQAFTFDTRITTDGYKLFQLAHPRILHQARLPSTSNDRRQRSQHYSEKRILSALEQTLSGNGYCRQGYVLLGRAGGETSNRLRGECREKATPRDRQIYTDTIERW